MASIIYKGGESSLPSQSGHSGKVLGTVNESLLWLPPTNLSGVFTTDSLFTWQSKTANFTAQSGFGYFINTVDNVLIDFPSSPTIGDTFQVVLVANGQVGFNETVNGVTVASLGTDFYQGTNVNEKVFRFYYLNSTYGWFCDQPDHISVLYFGAADPYFNNIVLFLKGDGTNGSTTIIDSSPQENIITNSNAVISTTQSKYGGSSIYFNGTAKISCPDRDDLPPTTDPFTLEYWIYPINLNGYLLGKGDAWSIGGSSIAHTISGVTIYSGGASAAVTTALTINTWQHIAIVRTPTTLRLFQDGISISSAAFTTPVNNTPQALEIGGYANLPKTTCYIDSLRFTQGVARYTENFNPETDTFLDI